MGGNGRASIGVQNGSPQDLALWYADCFELKAISALGSRKTSAPPFNNLDKLASGAFSTVRDYQQ